MKMQIRVIKASENLFHLFVGGKDLWLTKKDMIQLNLKTRDALFNN